MRGHRVGHVWRDVLTEIFAHADQECSVDVLMQHVSCADDASASHRVADECLGVFDRIDADARLAQCRTHDAIIFRDGVHDPLQPINVRGWIVPFGRAHALHIRSQNAQETREQHSFEDCKQFFGSHGLFHLLPPFDRIRNPYLIHRYRDFFL